MRVVVTGALGHIGSALIRYQGLLDSAEEIVMIDNLSTQRYTSLFGLPPSPRFRFVHGNVTDCLDDRLLRYADAVIHLAGMTNPSGSFLDPIGLITHNLGGTQHVVDACVAAGVPLIFTSSTSVYTPKDAIADESCVELSPVSPYAQCKLQEESYVLDNLGEGEAIIFRLGTIFGTSPGMQFHTAVNKFCWQAATGVPIELWTTAAQQTRPYLSVGDAVSALSRAATNGVLPGRIINAVSCNATAGDVLTLIQACGFSPQVHLVSSPAMSTHSFSVCTDAAHALGFTFRGDLKTGVMDTLATLGSLK